MNKLNYGMIGTTLLILLVFASVPTALGAEAGGLSPAALDIRSSFSGDDAYDPAAGGTPELAKARDADSTRWVALGEFYASFPARGRNADSARWTALAARFAPAFEASLAVSYSGDDAYDEAAGGTPELSVLGFASSFSSSLSCALSAEEISARGAWSLAGGYSGDDAYDPAAGGTPELSLLPFAEDLALLAACEPVALSN